MTQWKKLEEALKRQKRFEIEIAQIDGATRFHLLAAWKEQVIEDCIAALRYLDHPDGIANIDRAIAVSIDVYSVKKELAEAKRALGITDQN